MQRDTITPELLETLDTNTLPNIMLVGYWPPTNEMIRHFSPDPIQNPSGWEGADWEGRGYNIYAFFPEFPSGPGQGEGDFEVDYQDTSEDFWLITDQVDPVAILTFGRAYNDWNWEVEWRHRNLSEFGWVKDYTDPKRPTPSPPDSSAPAAHRRYASLPCQMIVDAVNDAQINVNSFIGNVGNSGSYLCEYLGYHAQWYHDLHADPTDPIRNIAAGHIHVGYAMDLNTAILAAEISVRTLTDYLNQSLVPNYRALYESTGGTIHFDLNMTSEDAGRKYLLLVSASGTSPGYELPGGVILPINWDVFTDLEMALLNTAYFSTFLGTLDAAGHASAEMNTFGPLPSGTADFSLYYAFALSRKPDGWYASESVDVLIVP